MSSAPLSTRTVVIDGITFVLLVLLGSFLLSPARLKRLSDLDPDLAAVLRDVDRSLARLVRAVGRG